MPLVAVSGTDFICYLLVVYNFILLARVILSWIPSVPDALRPIVDVIYAVTEPVLRFARPLVPPLRMGMVALDMSILLVFFVLLLLRIVFC